MEEVGEITVIRVTENKLYQNVVTPFREQMVSLLDKGKRNFIVNLSMVDLMNSSGLGMLISGLTTLRSSGGDLRLTNLSDKVRRPLEITKLESVFLIYNSVEEAVNSYKIN